MERKKYSPRSILKIALGIVFGAWLMMCAPTGWIYDLWAGTGTGQGQTPDPSVSVVHTQSDVEDAYFQDIPVTATKEGLIEAPLLRLRDTDEAGEHTHRTSGGGKRTIFIGEYIPVAYPTGPVRNFLLHTLASGYYNRYYLAPLEDGTYVCVYFDDYLMLRTGEELPTGYIRDTTTEEKTMLRQIAEDYEVDPVYVLDMYRHGKVILPLELVIRFGVLLLLLVVGSAIMEGIKKVIRRKAEEKTKRQTESCMTLITGRFQMKNFNEITNNTEANRMRIADVETASGQENKKIIFEESDYYISLVAEGKEDFVIFQSHDGFFQFYGIGNQFICEVWFNLNGRRAYTLINPDCTNTKRINFVTPFGQYTPRERDIISLEQLKTAVHEYFVNLEETNFLAKVPYEKIEM